MNQARKIVLAYSGGLDTSYCIPYLREQKGFEVVTVTVDTGGFDAAELTEIEERSSSLGAIE
ncbi:MAG: argininosuccinate synthase, partial [Planctomycetes bacterium]|nr:argininosuccinate synthase [Planctomycetota bacterium]